MPLLPAALSQNTCHPDSWQAPLQALQLSWNTSCTPGLLPCSLLRSHLAQHPQVLHSFPKEPEFFTETCNFNALRCNRSAQFQYMRDVSAASWMDLCLIWNVCG